MMLNNSETQRAWNVGVEAASNKQSRKWPELNTDEIGAVMRRYGEGAFADLLNSSESWPDDIASRQTECLIDQLFPGNPRLSCGKSMHEISTRSRENWRGHLAQQQFIVPNIVGRRRFMVFDFDDDEFIHQASMLKSLSELAPLVCVVHSGFTSLEGWLLVRGMPKKKVRDLFAYATSLEASPSNWIRSQPVRMPGGLRDGGLRQRIYHLKLQALRNEQ
jgi:hypothetical protein